MITRYFSPGDGGGEAPPAGDGGGESWHGQHAYFQQNPDAVKSFADFKSADDVFKSYSELRKAQSQPYRLPKDTAKLTDEQRAEIDGYYRKSKGIPETPEGYEFDADDEVPDHEPTLAKFRALAHERGVDPQTAQDLLGLQRGMVKELNAHREKVIQGMTDNNYKTFLNEDCGGDKEVAAQQLEQVKRYLQTQFTKDGEVDTEGWEKFAARIYHGDRVIELPILRALAQAAQLSVGTGGAPVTYGQAMAKGGTRLYAEMHK
jgi:hypothetical protein